MAKRSMFVGMDVHKESIDVSLAEEGRHGEVRHYGVIPGDLEAVANGRLQPRRLMHRTSRRRLQRRVSQLHHTPGISLLVRDAYASYSPLNSSLINFSSGPSRSAHINNIATT